MTEMSRHAAARWRGIYGDLDNAGIAAALRGWCDWRQEQIALHPDVADRITETFEAATAWLRQEVQRRLTPKPAGPRVTTAQLVAHYGDRLRQTGDRYRAACPWHEDTRPSLVIFERGWCHCFTCVAHHPVADLAAMWDGREEAA